MLDKSAKQTEKYTVFENDKKVAFNIASEASYLHKSSLKMPKMVNFGEFLKT